MSTDEWQGLGPNAYVRFVLADNNRCRRLYVGDDAYVDLDAPVRPGDVVHIRYFAPDPPHEFKEFFAELVSQTAEEVVVLATTASGEDEQIRVPAGRLHLLLRVVKVMRDPMLDWPPEPPG